jgi:heme exporter protein D
MDYNSFDNMMGSGAGFFMWIAYILVTAALILGVVALWKYINMK